MSVPNQMIVRLPPKEAPEEEAKAKDPKKVPDPPEDDGKVALSFEPGKDEPLSFEIAFVF